MCSAIQPCLRAEIGADAQREALFPEQHIAAVAGADRDDRVVLRKMADEAALRIDIEQQWTPRLKSASLVAELIERDLAHARHDPHVQHDVDRVGDLEADLGQRRTGRAHEVRHDVHRAPAHRAFEQAVQLRIHLRRLGPVVRRPGFLLRRRADEGALLDARDVVRIRAMEIAARKFLLVQLDQHVLLERLPRAETRFRAPSRRTRKCSRVL